MRVRYLLLVLLGVAMGQICRAGWAIDSAVQKELGELAVVYAPLVQDERLDLRPDAKMDAATQAQRRRDLSELRSACLAYEDRCRKAMEANPNTLTHQYLLLRARHLTDEIANLIIWHDLVADGRKSVPIDPMIDWDLEEAVLDARRRLAIAGGAAGLGEAGPRSSFAAISLCYSYASALQW